MGQFFKNGTTLYTLAATNVCNQERALCSPSCLYSQFSHRQTVTRHSKQGHLKNF